jgi:hypothetical protein
MKKILFATTIIVAISISNLVNAQIIDIDYTKAQMQQSLTDTTEKEEQQVELLSRGFVDIFTNGKMQGTAQLLKINIGEPDAFYIPLFILVGASGDGLGEQEKNENTVANLLNPIGGIFNGTVNGRNNLYSSSTGITSLKFAYQLSGKLINAQDSLTGESKFLGAGYGNAGLFFQTGAWEPDAEGNMGVFWMQAKVTGSYAFDNAILTDVFGSTVTDNYFIGYSIDLGIEINNRINLKAGAYQYLNNQDIELMKKPVFKFSLDYNLN